MHPWEKTALHLAAYDGNDALVAFLLHFGANASVVDGNTQTPLHISVAGGYANITRMLSVTMDDAGRQRKDQYGRTARDIADIARLDLSESVPELYESAGWEGVAVKYNEHAGTAYQMPAAARSGADAGTPANTATDAEGNTVKPLILQTSAPAISKPPNPWPATMHTVPASVFANLPASGCHFDVVEETDETPDDFFIRYNAARQPLLIRGGAKKFPAYTKWSAKLLAETYKTRNFTLSHIPYAKLFGAIEVCRFLRCIRTPGWYLCSQSRPLHAICTRVCDRGVIDSGWSLA